MGKKTEINKQSHVKYWFNRKKYGAVSYFFSCNKNTLKTFIYFQHCADREVKKRRQMHFLFHSFDKNGRFTTSSVPCQKEDIVVNHCP